MCLHSVGSVSYVVTSIRKSSYSTELLSPNQSSFSLENLLHSRESVCLSSPVCNLSPILFREFFSYGNTFLKELQLKKIALKGDTE